MAGDPQFARTRNAPQQRRSAATFAAIIAAADQVFGEMGVERAKTTDIASRAGVSVGSLYHLFPDKSAIASALADRYLDEATLIYIGAAEHLQTVEDVPRFIAAVTRDLAALNDQHPGFFAVARHTTGTLDESPSAHVRTAQIDGLTDLFMPFAPEVTMADARRVAAVCIDVARALLERMPPEGEERDHYLVEFNNLVVRYLAGWLPGLIG